MDYLKKVNFGFFLEHHSVAEQYVVLKCLYQSARFHSSEDNYCTKKASYAAIKKVYCSHLRVLL